MVVRDSASGLHYLHQDHLGSASLQTSSSGAYEGHEFRGPFGQPWASGGSLATDLQYTDQRSFESSLGSLFFYGSRWYSPVVGRFLQPDSLVPSVADPQALNPYSYTRNNPLALVDPTGHAYESPVREYSGEKTEKGGVWSGVYQVYRTETGDTWEKFIPYDLKAVIIDPDAPPTDLSDDDPQAQQVASVVARVEQALKERASSYYRTVDEDCSHRGGLENLACFGNELNGELHGWVQVGEGQFVDVTILFPSRRPGGQGGPAPGRPRATGRDNPDEMSRQGQEWKKVPDLREAPQMPQNPQLRWEGGFWERVAYLVENAARLIARVSKDYGGQGPGGGSGGWWSR